MFTHVTFWPWFAGVVILAIGLVRWWPLVGSAKGIEKLIAMGPVLYAIPLAAFGAEHFAITKSITELVPAWLPARVFWTYFAGSALICAAVGIALRIYGQLAAMLVGVLFLLFVATIHIPNLIAEPGSRFLWAVALRDASFGGAGFALAARRTKRLRVVGRILGAPLVFFAVEHFLHPQFAPGVPLRTMTPEWVPARALWGYLMGAVLLVAGVLMLLDGWSRRARVAAAVLGGLIVAFTLFMYLPNLVMAAPAGVMGQINVVFDTLLFGGAVLAAAGILGDGPVSD